MMNCINERNKIPIISDSDFRLITDYNLVFNREFLCFCLPINDNIQKVHSICKICHIFPNPANEIITIQATFDIVYAEIYDAAGRAIPYNIYCMCNTAEIDISQYAAGTYMVKVFGANESGTGIFIKV